MRLFTVRALLPVLLLGWLLGCKESSDSQSGPSVTPLPETTTFKNPLLASGPDPWVIEKDGFYYYMATTGGNLTLRKTAKMSELGSAVSTVIWTPSASGVNSRDIWAPELHFLDGKWYVYFTAGPGQCCAGQRLWVLENSATDPTTGTWVEKGQIAVPGQDLWAIDATILEQNGGRYLVWSGHANASTEEQRLYITRLSNPWTITGPRAELSRPQYSWEKIGPVPVNEGPQILQRNGKTFLVYSASHCTTDSYALGMLTASSTADPMDPAVWTKTAMPVFTSRAAGGAFGPGHNSFFKSKNGQQDWILYHANPEPGKGCENTRNPRMQPFTWNSDGTPNFGTPAAIGVELPEPGGE